MTPRAEICDQIDDLDDVPTTEAARPRQLTFVDSGDKTLAPDGGITRGGIATTPGNRATSEECGVELGDNVGRYIIVSELGAGGMGVVFEGFDPDLDRKVAIKLLRAAPSSDSLAGTQQSMQARARLVQEAQSLAQLAHPNIVPIFDVGHANDQVYIAMEMVAGIGLDRWIRERPRHYREILRVFLQAADGLAAAHKAGIVHRDFKPENVILGDDGRPRIVDFGLAYQERKRGASITSDSKDPRRRELESTLANSMTGIGSVVGTPSFMAPEQHEGAETDESCDQYAFCISLYEALYGVRPFRGSNLDAIAWAKTHFQLSEPTGKRSVPRWLRRLVLQGLAVQPADRNPSMAAIAAEIRERISPRRRNARLAGLAVTLCIGSASMQLMAAHQQRDVCEGASQTAARIWPEQLRLQAESAFLNVGLGHARTSFNKAAAAMDRYLETWSGQSRAACEAMHIEGRITGSELLLRNECLNSKLAEAEVLIGAWTTADKSTVHHAVSAVSTLSDLDECRDHQSWQAQAALPSDPDDRALALKLESDLFEARLASVSGHRTKAQRIALESSMAARAINYLPVQAEAHSMLAMIAADTFAPKEARDQAMLAMDLAEASGDEKLAAKVAIDQIWIRGYMLRDHRNLGPLIEHAHAHVARNADDTTLRAWFARSMGALHSSRGQLDDSLQSFREVVDLLEGELDPHDPQLLTSYANLASTLEMAGLSDEAEVLFRKAMAGELAVFGADHPRRLLTLGNLAYLLQSQGRATEALKILEDALLLADRAQVDDAMQRLRLMSNRAGLLESLGRNLEAAEIWEACFELHRSVSQREDPQLLISGSAMISLHARLGNLGKARALVERLIPLIERVKHHPRARFMAHISQAALIDFTVAQGDLDLAEDYRQQLRAAQGRRGGGSGMRSPGMLEGIRLDLAQGRCSQVLETIETEQTTNPRENQAFGRLSEIKGQALLSCQHWHDAEVLFRRQLEELEHEEAAASHLRPRLRAALATATLGRAVAEAEPAEARQALSRQRDQALAQLELRELPAGLRRVIANAKP